jgi:hypothetical protein
VDLVVAETALALSGDSRRRSADPEVRIITTVLPNAKYQVPYNERVLCTPGQGPCAWQVQDSSLPAGLVFDPASGVISGTPSEAATGLLALLAYDTLSPLNSTTATLTITVDPPDLVVSVPAIPAGKVGEPFHLALSVSGALGNVSWSVVSGQFPDGVNLDATSGEIAGTPTTFGTTTALVQAQDSWGAFHTAVRTVTVTIAPASIQISTSALPAAVYHSRYEATLTATGGTGSYRWSVTAGEVPGLAVDGSGLVTGEPQCIGSFSLNVEATDTKWPGYMSSGTVSLEIVPTPFSVSIPAAPVGVIGSPYSLTASTSGQVGTVTWSLGSGQLPPGLTLNATGAISGVPTAFGVFTAVVQAHDSYSTCGTPEVTRTAERSVVIAIAPLPIAITTATLPSGHVRKPYRAVLESTGGTGDTTWSLVDGRVPDGLSLSSAGVISGRPTAAGTFSFTVQASDVGWAGNAANRTFSVTIRAREVVLYSSDANRIAGTWSLAPDETAAGGSRMWNPDKSADKIDVANPANYFEIPFQAEAGVAYHLWVRGKADKDKRVNDAVMVQFSGSVDAAAAPAYRIGTASATDVNLADCNGCHLSGWGWQDNGRSVMGPAIYFEQGGAQTIRVQVQQDGFSIDQIVLSAETFLTDAPGALKNDWTIVPRE